MIIPCPLHDGCEAWTGEERREGDEYQWECATGFIWSSDATGAVEEDDPGTMTNGELIDALAEMYPGEVPDNDQILAWIHELAEKAWQWDRYRQER